MSGAVESVRVRLLGGLVVEGLSRAELGSRKARTLVKVLVLARGAPVSVAALADVLWGDDRLERPGDQIGVLVSRLRKVLGAQRLVRSDAGFSLHVDWLDVDELAALVREASAALHDGRLAATRAAAGAALVLARGVVLPDDEGEWLEAERASASASVSRARAIAATAALQAGDIIAAELAAESALAHGPYDEVALRVLMLAQAAGGRSASALASYARARERLAGDLGVSPSAETEALHVRGVDQWRRRRTERNAGTVAVARSRARDRGARCTSGRCAPRGARRPGDRRGRHRQDGARRALR